MRFLYLPFEETLPDDSSGAYTAFGLQCWQIEIGHKTLKAAVPDISCEKSFVVSLARQFTHFQLSPLHFQDAVEDAVS